MRPTLETATAEYLAVSRLAHGDDPLWSAIEHLAWVRLENARLRRECAQLLVARLGAHGSAA